MKRSFLFILCLCFSKLLFAALTVNTTIADCNTPGSMTLSSTIGIVDSFSYSGTNNGTVIGNTVMLNAGIYSVTATLSNGSTETLANVIVDHNDHIQLKNWYLTGNIPSTSVNWGITLNDPLMSNWSDIYVNTSGCVSSVFLQYKGISGTIPNFNLSYLTYLNLSENQLTGTIPNFNLPNLTYLSLYDNQLTGNIPNFNLPNLQSLGLGKNYLSGSFPSFSNTPNLKELNLSRSYLTGPVPNFSNFTSLNLDYCNLNMNISNLNLNLNTLKLLSLEGNNLTGVVPNISISTDLAYFNLSNNKLSGGIPSFNLPNLIFLKLNNNQLNDTIPNFIASKLEVLDLSTNQLIGNIPNFNLPKLLFLKLQNNKLNGCLPINLKTQCPLLDASRGDISNNPYLATQNWSAFWNNNAGVCTPCSSLTVDFSLAGLKLFSTTNALFPNYLWSSGSNADYINPSQSGTYSLTVTQLDGCKVSITKNITLPFDNTITESTCSSLGKIIFGNTNISSYAYTGASIGNGLGNQIELAAGIYQVTLTMSNGSTSFIPNVEIPNKEHQILKSWYFGNAGYFWKNNWKYSLNDYTMNGWTGITKTNGCISKIELSNMALKGNIPNFDLPNLQSLNLSYNNLSGTIPNFNLPGLTTIDFSFNQLSGTIPNFNNLGNIKSIKLDNNKLSGSIPNFMLPSLSNLNLSFNLFSDTIPNFQNLQNLNNLILMRNNLSGSIPKFDIEKLTSIDLSFNQLVGSIPLFVLPNLISMNLSNNQLSGCISLGIITGCPNLKYVSISNNPNLATQFWPHYSNNYAGACSGVVFNAKIFLQHFYSGISNGYLNRLASFPKTDPYALTPLNNNFIHKNNPILARASKEALNTSIVPIEDWVFLELRQGSLDSTVVLFTKSALLRRDGVIAGLDRYMPVIFENAPSGDYYIAVRHRNHLGFRTKFAISLSTTSKFLDFTTNTIPLYGSTPTIALNATQHAMIAGDSNSDGSIDALDTILWESQNGLFDDYINNADYNMDGSVDAFDSIFWELNNGKFQELD